MELVKRCPACEEENPVSEVICRVCMTNLSAISPTPKGSFPLAPEQEEPVGNSVLERDEAFAAPPSALNPGDTVREEAAPVLTLFRVSDGRAVPAMDGSILGRSEEYKVFFDDSRTVSRRHALVSLVEGKWNIEDLSSMNGTWINGKRLETGRRYPLKAGDIVSLSLACELKVIA